MAHWIQPPDEYFYPYCSDCGAECLSYRDYDSLSPHCPNCGSKMDRTRNYIAFTSTYWISKGLICTCKDVSDCPAFGDPECDCYPWCSFLKGVEENG